MLANRCPRPTGEGNSRQLLPTEAVGQSFPHDATDADAGESDRRGAPELIWKRPKSLLRSRRRLRNFRPAQGGRASGPESWPRGVSSPGSGPRDHAHASRFVPVGLARTKRGRKVRSRREQNSDAGKVSSRSSRRAPAAAAFRAILTRANERADGRELLLVPSLDRLSRGLRRCAGFSTTRRPSLAQRARLQRFQARRGSKVGTVGPQADSCSQLDNELCAWGAELAGLE